MYNDDMLKAAEYAHAAVFSMTKHRIPPTPLHFTVWYEYHSGREPELIKAMDAMLAANMPFTPDSVLELYEKHLNPARLMTASRAAAEQLEKVIGKVKNQIDSVEKNTREYGASLASFSNQLDDGTESRKLGGLVDTMQEETQAMRSRNKALEAELAKATAEVKQLRQNFEQARRDALTDPLTGLANRKRFEAALDVLVKAATDRKDTVSLLIIDIDFFKRFNDTHGHQFGDQVLQIVGKTLANNTKGHDVAARYGGEEFAIVLPFTKLEQAYSLGNSIRTAISQIKLQKPDSSNELAPITVSIGAAQYRPGESLAQFIQRTDEALYAAKHGGRNRVVADSRHIESVAAH